MLLGGEVAGKKEGGTAGEMGSVRGDRGGEEVVRWGGVEGLVKGWGQEKIVFVEIGKVLGKILNPINVVPGPEPFIKERAYSSFAHFYSSVLYP